MYFLVFILMVFLSIVDITAMVQGLVIYPDDWVYSIAVLIFCIVSALYALCNLDAD